MAIQKNAQNTMGSLYNKQKSTQKNEEKARNYVNHLAQKTIVLETCYEK